MSVLLGLLSSFLVRQALAVEWPDLAATPRGSGDGRADAALVIAIEDYARVDDVEGASRNADDWVSYLVKTRGVPAQRLMQLRNSDATDLAMRRDAKAVASAVQPGGTLWLVFIGHGAPSRDGSDGLLVGADADRSAEGIYGRSVPQRELLEILDAGRQANTVAVIDACFSGQGVDGKALVAGLQPLVPTSQISRVAQRTRVLSATSSGEFSGPLPGAARPAFSYLALGALRGWADVDGGNGDGRVSAAEVRDYVRGALGLTLRGRRQTPALLGDSVDLVSVVERTAPDLLAIASSGHPDTRSGETTVQLGGASEDFARLAAEATSKARERERMAREALLAQQALETARRQRLEARAAEVRGAAERDFGALRPLLALGEVPPEGLSLLNAFVMRYRTATVSVDGVTESVPVPQVALVEQALMRLDLSAGRGGPGGPIDVRVQVRDGVCTDADARLLAVDATDASGRTWPALRGAGCVWRVRHVPLGRYRIDVRGVAGSEDAFAPASEFVILLDGSGARIAMTTTRYDVASLTRPPGLDPSIGLMVDGVLLTSSEPRVRRRGASVAWAAVWAGPDGTTRRVVWKERVGGTSDAALPWALILEDEHGAAVSCELFPPSVEHARVGTFRRAAGSEAAQPVTIRTQTRIPARPGAVVRLRVQMAEVAAAARTRARNNARWAAVLAASSGLTFGGAWLAADAAGDAAAAARAAEDPSVYHASLSDTRMWRVAATGALLASGAMTVASLSRGLGIREVALTEVNLVDVPGSGAPAPRTMAGDYVRATEGYERRRMRFRRAVWLGVASGAATGGMAYALAVADGQAGRARTAVDTASFEDAVAGTRTWLGAANGTAVAAGVLATLAVAQGTAAAMTSDTSGTGEMP
jgi:hypothetical protein